MFRRRMLLSRMLLGRMLHRCRTLLLLTLRGRCLMLRSWLAALRRGLWMLDRRGALLFHGALRSWSLAFRRRLGVLLRSLPLRSRLCMRLRSLALWG